MSEWAKKLLDEVGAEPWEAVITQGGRWTWHIDPVKGVMGLREGYISFGTRAHAEKVARRKLARLRRDDARMAARTVVR